MRYAIKEETLTSLGDAIREKTGGTEKMSIDTMIETIGNISGGVDSGLNFSIVGGTSEPTSPKENMIWVNTDVAVGEWQMDYIEPTARNDGSELTVGDMWFQLSRSSNAPFNALKKNFVAICIAGCKQYNGSEYEAVDSMIYQNNEWKLFAQDIIIIPNLTAFPDSAWSIVRVDGNNIATDNAHSLDNTKMTTSETDIVFNLAARETNGWTAYYIPVETTGLSTMTIKGTIPNNAKYGTLYIGLFDTIDNPKINPILIGVSQNLDSTTYTLNNTYDISSFNGTKYLMVGVYATNASNRAWGYVTLTDLSLTV